MRGLLLALLAAAALAAPPALAFDLRGELEVFEQISELDEALSRWDMPVADWAADRLLAEHPEHPGALMAAGRVAFHHSDYDRARELAERAVAAAAGDPDWEELAGNYLGFLEERREIWDAFEEYPSETFVIRVTERDRILVPMAREALEAAARALYEDLGFCPAEPVVVEIYPKRSSFIAVSTLTREEVETSGTVAICHFNRLMLISPGVMAQGYDWLDTITHEYVHYAVYHLGHDAVPVWLHEGIAKVLESRWRLPEPEPLDPRSTTILAEARDSGRWVTFEEMHPSMAKLPSGELVSLAFAQVASAVEMIRERGGTAQVSELVRAVRDADGDLDAALGEAVGTDFEGFEQMVREHLRTADLYRIPGVTSFEDLEGLPFEFADEEGAPASGDEAEVRRKLADREARDWTLLGDRMKGRGYLEAAVIEYDKALSRLGHSEPLVANRKALALLTDGRTAEALPVLESVLRDYPTLTTTLDNLVETHLRLADDAARAEAPVAGLDERGHLSRALELARRSLSVNPFNPDAHVRLVSLLDRLGRPDEAEAARAQLRMLRALG